jgi:CRP-like cAMP-binding protein
MQALFRYFTSISPLSKQAQAAIAEIASEQTLNKNKELQAIGHTCKTIYFLKKGVARIYYFKESTDITESFSFENSLVVRYESLFTSQPSKKGIQVLEDAELIAIKSTELFKLYDTHPDIERLFRKLFEAALVEQINRIESLQFHTAEERYAALLKEAPDVIKRVPLKFIASYLGITAVSLSRIRAQK